MSIISKGLWIFFSLLFFSFAGYGDRLSARQQILGQKHFIFITNQGEFFKAQALNRVGRFFSPFVQLIWPKLSIDEKTLKTPKPKNFDQEPKQASASSLPSKKQFLTKYFWRAKNSKELEKAITVHFVCERGGKLKIALTAPAPLASAKESIAVIEMWAGNTPPSGKGYMKFVYVSQFLKNTKKLTMDERDISRFMKELMKLREQTFKNEKIALKEYQEKINYCQNLPKDRRQKCYNSSSGYQAVEPFIALWIRPERRDQIKIGLASQFDPHDLDNLKRLSCYKKRAKPRERDFFRKT